MRGRARERVEGWRTGGARRARTGAGRGAWVGQTKEQPRVSCLLLASKRAPWTFLLRLAVLVRAGQSGRTGP